MTAFIVSPAGRAMIEKYEGCLLQAYQDIVGVWTIGYGNTGIDIGPGTVWSQQDADNALTRRLANEFGAAVNQLCGDHPTTQGQFDAMVSLAYNIGVGAFKHSSVLRDHLEGDYDSAADAFLLWDKAGGREIRALARRRQEEAQMYLDASLESNG